MRRTATPAQQVSLKYSTVRELPAAIRRSHNYHWLDPGIEHEHVVDPALVAARRLLGVDPESCGPDEFEEAYVRSTRVLEQLQAEVLSSIAADLHAHAEGGIAHRDQAELAPIPPSPNRRNLLNPTAVLRLLRGRSPRWRTLFRLAFLGADMSLTTSAERPHGLLFPNSYKEEHEKEVWRMSQEEIQQGYLRDLDTIAGLPSTLHPTHSTPLPVGTRPKPNGTIRIIVDGSVLRRGTMHGPNASTVTERVPAADLPLVEEASAALNALIQSPSRQRHGVSICISSPLSESDLIPEFEDERVGVGIEWQTPQLLPLAGVGKKLSRVRTQQLEDTHWCVLRCCHVAKCHPRRSPPCTHRALHLWWGCHHLGLFRRL